MIIAVDGPAASGKGTLAAGLARHLNLPHLDTGLLYRAVGRATLPYQQSEDFHARAIEAARALDAEDLDPEFLGSQQIGDAASKVAVIGEVREALFHFQRAFSQQPTGAVLDGRDIGTRICPDATVKLFIIADARERAERRARQFEARGQQVDREELLRLIEERDARDRANPNGAFYPAADAHLLDTTQLDIEAALRAAVAIVDEVRARKAKP
ncbi:MAG TPA: (d)CMP kinase [Devosiaceae bacterium]|jgi:cytidylate kinase|nr:(d)CMP kinase [Devosiaceae bacterium]